MNLLLFETPEGESYPVLERAPFSTIESLPEGASRWRKLRVNLQQSYQRLKEKFDHSETVCANLRQAESLKVIHRSDLSATDAEKKLRRFFKLSYSKHSRWLLADAALAAAGSVLTPVPGPNIFFFYPAVRAMAHYFAKQGARRGQQVGLLFERDSLINRVQENIDNLEAATDALLELETRYNIEGLENQLKRLKGR